MSIDYFIFLKSDGPAERIFEPLRKVPGVKYQGEFYIHGLAAVICEQLSISHQQVMLDAYGSYGLSVNWVITGSNDYSVDILELIERLYRCAAIFLNADPDQPLSLMREGSSFYLFNDKDRLILSPIYLEKIPVIRSLFKKPFTVEEINY